jgi:Fe-S-cluster-containing hydrogenase component 2
MPAVVNKDECVGCGACVEVCPQEAITMDDIAIIDVNECIDCGACVDECPNGAITIKE